MLADDVCGCPRTVYISYDGFEILEKEYQKCAVRGFLNRWKNGDLRDDEVQKLTDFLRRRVPSLAEFFGEYLAFYEFIIVQKILTRPTAQKILARLESIECRAVVLKYLHGGR